MIPHLLGRSSLSLIINFPFLSDLTHQLQANCSISYFKNLPLTLYLPPTTLYCPCSLFQISSKSFLNLLCLLPFFWFPFEALPGLLSLPFPGNNFWQGHYWLPKYQSQVDSLSLLSPQNWFIHLVFLPPQWSLLCLLCWISLCWPTSKCSIFRGLGWTTSFSSTLTFLVISASLKVLSILCKLMTPRFFSSFDLP